MCPAFVLRAPSLPKSHHHPSLYLFLSPHLLSGRLDYVAKESFFLFSLLFSFLRFSLFPIDLVLMHFECPLVYAEGWGGEGRVLPSGGIWMWSSEEGAYVGEGPKRGTQVRTEVVCRAEEPLPYSPHPFSPHSLFQGRSSTGSPQVHCQSFLIISKPNPWAKQTLFPWWEVGKKRVQQLADQIKYRTV